MRRRQFLATLPLAAAGRTSFCKTMTDRLRSSDGQDSGTKEELQKYQAADAERFIRPDVHAGDRPAGASFASRSAALGCSGAAGTAHPIATQAAIAMLKRGGSAVDAAVAANACLGFLEPTSAGLGGDVGSQTIEGDGNGEFREIAEVAFARDRKITSEKWCAAEAGRDLSLDSGRAGRVVDTSPALRQIEMGRTL